jgi:murein DD-endopeptidase MepM/ murein hydrolase activator NlpD
MGVTERIAEAREILVKEGDVVRAGQPVVRGEDLNPDGSIRTGVIHYEIRKGKANASGKFEGTLDPVKFLRDRGQEVKERYPNIGMTNMNKYASIFESPNGGKLNSYELAQAPEVIPFDIAMVLNSETTSGTLTETGTGAIALGALENVPELPSSEFESVRQVIMAMAKISREG